MAHLTKPTVYDIKDSNIALLGSDLEKRVREQAGEQENAWEGAGARPGLQIWRVEKFHVVDWPTERRGSFYDGDSYIVLHTYEKSPDSDALSYDLHFWLGEHTTQDEAGTAAYKTVELDDHLHGAPVQYREVQGYESPLFLSYFPRFVCLKGGVATGFHHVSDPPLSETKRLYRVTLWRFQGISNLVIREVPAEASSLVAGDAYVLDKGKEIWQFNTKTSAGMEKFKAGELVQSLVSGRKGQYRVTVYEEGSSGAGRFLSEFGDDTTLRTEATHANAVAPTLFRLSDATGTLTFEKIEPAARSSLHSSDAFLLDNSSNPDHPAIYVWIGKESSLTERRLAAQYAQRYLYDKQKNSEKDGEVQVAISVVKMNEGSESEEFLRVMSS